MSYFVIVGCLSIYELFKRFMVRVNFLNSGLAVSRSLGNHFVKEQNIGMIAEPYVHECIKIENTDQFVIIASDGVCF